MADEVNYLFKERYCLREKAVVTPLWVGALRMLRLRLLHVQRLNPNMFDYKNFRQVTVKGCNGEDIQWNPNVWRDLTKADTPSTRVHTIEMIGLDTLQH